MSDTWSDINKEDFEDWDSESQEWSPEWYSYTLESLFKEVLE